MAKFKQRLLARKLRKEGESIKTIASMTGVSVSSVSLWCRDIRLTREKILALEKRYKDPFYGKRMIFQNRIKKEKNEEIKNLLAKGKEEIGILNNRELFISGAVLYWAEGFKKNKQAGLASMDPLMIKFFIKWLRVCFGYKNGDLLFRVTANISHKYRIKKITEFWSEAIGVPLDGFAKPFYQKYKWRKVYSNLEDYHGVLRIKVRKSQDFLRKIHGYIEGLRLQGNLK